jgi:hypothetical protein
MAKGSRHRLTPSQRWIRSQEQKLYRRYGPDGKRVSRTVRDTQLDAHVDRYQEQAEQSQVDQLMKNLAGGQRLNAWEVDFRGKLKDQYIVQYLAGRGGRDAMTQADWGSIGGMLKKQYGYLSRFTGQIAAGELSEEGRLKMGQIRARSTMYFNSAGQAFERGKVASVGPGAPLLPAYPGDGSTRCLSNCGCHWSIEEGRNVWRASWVLGPTEHCPDCVERASRWNPLRIEKTRPDRLR